MLAVPPPHNDEIDLFELFERFWRDRWLISAFVAISFLLGCGFLFISTPSYESKIVFSIQTEPFPNFSRKILKSEFKAKFYSKRTFDVWKSENIKTKLVYNDISITEDINGFIYGKKDEDLLAYFVEDKKKGEELLFIKTKDDLLINDLFRYTEFVNNKLTSEYVLRAVKELEIIRKEQEGFTIKDNSNGIFIQRFLDANENGLKTFGIKAPTFPKKTSPKTLVILALSIVLGGMIGVVFVLVNTHIRIRKKSVTKL